MVIKLPCVVSVTKNDNHYAFIDIIDSCVGNAQHPKLQD